METLEEIVRTLPHQPGVYIYKNSQGTILYVGKAKDLKRRVSSYFQRDDAVGAKTKILVSQIASIETIQTQSEFDALLLEAKLIHTHIPKYNIIAKDDKSPLYVEITMDEPLPRIIFVRKPKNDAALQAKKRLLFGPFQSGKTARALLRHLRGIVPYCTQKLRTGKPCFYTHLGMCDPCPSVIIKLPDGGEKKRLTQIYRRQIERIADILSGKSTTVLHAMEKEMQTYASHNEFEKANIIKTAITRLGDLHRHHYDPALYIQEISLLENIAEEQTQALAQLLRPYFPTLKTASRIECIDISNTMGQYATGSLVVLAMGRPDTSSYRRFRIRSGKTPNDFAMIREVLTRRLRHSEWPTPDLLVIDGGKGQLQSALGVLAEHNFEIPIIGLAKREEEIVVYIQGEYKILRLPHTSPVLQLLQKIRDESHRFAITYHKKLRSKAFLQV